MFCSSYLCFDWSTKQNLGKYPQYYNPHYERFHSVSNTYINWLFTQMMCSVVFLCVKLSVRRSCIPSHFTQLHICTGEWTQHLLKAKWTEYHHPQQKYSFRKTREIVHLCASTGGVEPPPEMTVQIVQMNNNHNCPQQFFSLAFISNFTKALLNE